MSQVSCQVLYLRSPSPERQVWFSLLYRCENWGRRVSEEVGEDDCLLPGSPFGRGQETFS